MSRAAWWWVFDTLGAILFAGSLALLLGYWTRTGAWALPLAGLVLSGVMRAGAQALAGIEGQREATGAKQGLRGELMEALLPTALARDRLVGEDLRLAIDEVEAYGAMAARFSPLRLAAVASPMVIAGAVALASWTSALIMLVTLVPFAVGMAFAGLAGKAEAERQLQALSRMSGLFVDRVATLPVILAFGAEDRVTRQIGETAREVARRTIQVLRVAFVSSAVLEFFAALSIALVAVYCGFSLLGLLPFPAPEKLTFARAFFALALAPEFYLGMRRMAAAYHDKQQGEAAAAGIDAALVDAENRRTQRPLPSHSTVRSLAIDDLLVTYADGNRVGPFVAQWNGPGLHAVTGETGAGKSTLLHAIIGTVPGMSGSVLVDGTPIAPAAVAPMVGWAGQRPLLLPGTLRDNLLLAGGPRVDLQPLLDACGLADVTSRRGLDLVIDPRGSGLSGGERRRIGLVRAVASGRPVLLLDEPTADLDVAAARQVCDLLQLVARERLVITATHDPALVARCDSVARMP